MNLKIISIHIIGNLIFYTKDKYIIKYNVCSLTKDFINLKCADTKCGLQAKLYNNKDLNKNNIIN